MSAGMSAENVIKIIIKIVIMHLNNYTKCFNSERALCAVGQNVSKPAANGRYLTSKGEHRKEFSPRLNLECLPSICSQLVSHVSTILELAGGGHCEIIISDSSLLCPFQGFFGFVTPLPVCCYQLSLFPL